MITREIQGLLPSIAQVNALRLNQLNVQPAQVSHKFLCVLGNMEGRQESEVS